MTNERPHDEAPVKPSGVVVNLTTPDVVPNSPLDYALRYAALGWRIVPVWWLDAAGRCSCGEQCTSPGKHPLGKLVPFGQNSASSDPAIVRAWWERFPQANIAVYLQPSGLAAIDIDPRNGGLATIEAVEAQHGPLVSDVLQFTGGGGEHRIFLAPAGSNLPGKLGPGVDVKLNGYVLLEPSNHVSGKRYAFEASSSPLDRIIPSPLPDWLRDLTPRVAPAGDPAPAQVIAPSDLAAIDAALPYIPAGEREVWLRVGFALHESVGGQSGYDRWTRWSQSAADKFDPVDQLRTWRHFRRRGLAGVTKATIFRYAQDHGWPNIGAALPAPVPVDAVAAPIAAAPPHAPDVPYHLLTVPGILGQAVDWINATARKPQPLFAVQAALALGSTIMGRRYRTDNDNWSALYFLNVGPSGSGKEHAKFAVEKLLEAAQLPQLIGVGRFASESGLVSSLIERPTQFSVLDEFGKLLQAASAQNNWTDRNTMRMLIEVWGRANGVIRPTAYSTAGLSSKQAEDIAKRCVRNPSLALVALSTAETLFRGLTTDAVADGFLNRFLPVYADRGRQLARAVPPIEPPVSLLAWMREVRSRAPGAGNLTAYDAAHDAEPTPIVVPFSAAATARFTAFELAMHSRMNELDAEGLSEMLMRATEQAMRLALIVAVSLDLGEINAIAASWACDYVHHHAERNIHQLRQHLSEGPFHALCKEVLRAAAKAGIKGVTERELAKLSAWNRAPARMQQEALASLQRQEHLAFVDLTKPGQRGRKRNAWVAIESEDG